MNFRKLFFIILIGSFLGFVQGAFAQNRKPSQANPNVAAGKTTKKTAPQKKGRSNYFYYVSGSYFSFADEIFVKISGTKAEARTIFTGYNLGSDFTRYMGRYIFTWNLNVLSGYVDIQRVLGVTYPRKAFWGLQSGPELGYRINSDLDLTYGLNLLYREIQSVGQSFAFANQINLKFRFSSRLTFFQSLGNYGKPTSYSYGVGLRWLL